MKPIAIFAILVLAACTPESSQRAAALAQCSTQATNQGLEFGSDERNRFVATCVSAALTSIVIDESLEP